jgi:hypothetical protein
MSKKISELLTDESSGKWAEIVNNAPVIMAWFSNIVVIIADVRAYDVVYGLTESIWKALSASLACAIPFVLWEIGWQYNHTTEAWRKGSLFMAGLAFATSVFLGVADYLQFQGERWTSILLGGVVVLTGIHTVVGFLYYYNDPDVARRRHKAQALASMEDQRINAQVAEELLRQGDGLLQTIERLNSQYDPEEVEKILSIVQGRTAKKSENKQAVTFRPARAFASETKQVNPPLPPREQ